MRLVKYHGITLNRRSLGESDRLLTIFTKDSGKLLIYARSVRSARSRRTSSLEPFCLIKFGVVERRDRRTLTQVELLNSYRLGKQKLSDISRLFALGELIDGLLPEDDPHPEVYQLLTTALAHLSRFETSAYLIRFKLKLLELLGYGTPPGDLDAYLESLLSRPLRSSMLN